MTQIFRSMAIYYLQTIFLHDNDNMQVYLQEKEISLSKREK